jgi:hypothetical protein
MALSEQHRNARNKKAFAGYWSRARTDPKGGQDSHEYMHDHARIL